MKKITDIEELNSLKNTDALLVLFGGEHCGVCQSIKPQVMQMLENNFPEMSGIYIDCEQSHEICAQHSIFTIPVVQVYIDGKKVTEFGKSFSLKKLQKTIQRPYDLWKS